MFVDECLNSRLAPTSKKNPNIRLVPSPGSFHNSQIETMSLNNEFSHFSPHFSNLEKCAMQHILGKIKGSFQIGSLFAGGVFQDQSLQNCACGNSLTLTLTHSTLLNATKGTNKIIIKAFL